MSILIPSTEPGVLEDIGSLLTYNPVVEAYEDCERAMEHDWDAWREVWPDGVSAYVYGAASETVTIKKDGIIVATVETDSSGRSAEKIMLSHGMYTLTGSVSGWTEEQTVNKDTTKFRAMPSGLVLYWYGWEPNEEIYLLDHTIGYKFDVGTIYTKGNLTKNTNDFVLSYHTYCVNLRPTNAKIDFSQYNAINFIGRSNAKEVVCQSIDTNVDPATGGDDNLNVRAEAKGTNAHYTLDISGKTGVHYYSVRSTHSSTTVTSALWME